MPPQKTTPSLADSSALATSTASPFESSPSFSSLLPAEGPSWSTRPLRESTRHPETPSSPSSPIEQTQRRTKPVPSPLQQLNFSPLTRNPDGAAVSPHSPHSSLSSYHSGPRSPREKLDALLAEEDRSSGAATPTPTHLHFNSPTLPASAARAVPPSRPSAYAQLRNVSAPLLSSARTSPPSSPLTMPPPSRPNRPETRPTAPRNHSIDSQVSSLSSSTSQSYRASPGHQHKPSQDVSTLNPPDMASLVAAAGSVDAALQTMWKEKQSASNHNAQLWRLVEKQRAMILGLNKDLERALKDKERYRKKVKDYMNQVPPVPGAPQRSDTLDSVVEREDTPSPAPSERHEEAAKAPSAAKSGEHNKSPLAQEHTTTQAFADAQLAISPSRSSETHTATTSPTDYSVQPPHHASRGLGLDAIIYENIPTVEPPIPSATSTDTASRKDSNASSNTDLKAPALSLTQATPVMGGNGFEPAPEKPSRKAPPAPLNLSRTVQTSAHLHQQAPGEVSDDDYDDTLEVDEIPVVERGRRKTREEDDRMREAIFTKDEDARSKSKKKKSESKSKANSPEENIVGSRVASAAVPLSPRSFSTQQAGLPLSPRHPPANSLNALLSPTNSESSMMANRSITSPLMSPGLPVSPRPGDRPIGSPLPRNPKQLLVSPPMSPRTLPNGVPQPSPRPPRQPIPLPPNTPQSHTLAGTEASAQPKQTASSDLLKPPNAQPSPDSEYGSLSDLPSSEHVYRGLVSDQYPGLLLPPNALPSIEVRVFSSRLRPSRLSMLALKPQEEDPVFILAIYARSDGKQLWRNEKTIVALPVLDRELKKRCDFQEQLPDRTLFSGHAPAKMDARRAALNHYFNQMLETPMTEEAALLVCEFFSVDVIGIQSDDVLAPEPIAPAPSNIPATKDRQRKEGYLTKRGKNFGGWKARYFILDGPEFKYYEIVGGAHLGTIKLQNAQIGKQSQQQSNQSPQRRDDSEDNQYRHAFLILEPKRKDSTSLVRHVLCAESDEERDAWVEALLQHVDWVEEPSPTEFRPSAPQAAPSTHSQEDPRSQRNGSLSEHERRERLTGISYEDTVAAEAPIRGPTHREAKESHAPSPKNSSFSGESGQYPAISGPSNGAPIQNVESWGNKLAAPTSVKNKKRSIFGFRAHGSSEFGSGQTNSQAQQQQQQQATDRSMQANRNIFGIPLQEAVEYSQPIGVHVQLPSVVYRCLEYLKAKKASQEEGIFRLSGSNIVIKGLRDRFNNERDVKLLAGEYYDVHAVASLLKLYLRELPASILTRELHLDFLKVLEMDERSKKIQSFNVLVHRLPRVNLELLQAMSSFLIDIIDNASVNKMTVRNVGIVFAPTLNIPAPLISMFLTDYSDIFGVAVDEASSPIHEIQIITPPLADDAIRSPRRQMFSDLPTPAYNETTFPQPLNPPANFPMGPGAPSLQPPPQQQNMQYAGYDTGFIPLRPTYDAPMYEQKYQTEGYGSLDGAIQPGSARDTKQRRRESGMLLMNMGMGNGARKGSAPRVHGDVRVDPRMVREGTAFE